MKNPFSHMISFFLTLLVVLLAAGCSVQQVPSGLTSENAVPFQSLSFAKSPFPKKVALKSVANGKYLCVSGEWGPIYANSTTTGSDLKTVWHLADLRDGTFALKNMSFAAGGYITSDHDPYLPQYWPDNLQIIDLGNGAVAIRDPGYYSYASVGSSGNLALEPTADSIGPGETFIMEDMTGVYVYPAYLELPEVVAFKSSYANLFVSKSGNELKFVTTQIGNEEQFYSIDLGNGLYAFRSVVANVYADLWYKGGTGIFLMNDYGSIGSMHMYFMTNLGNEVIAMRNIADTVWSNQNHYARYPESGNNLQAVSTDIGEREKFQFVDCTPVPGPLTWSESFNTADINAEITVNDLFAYNGKLYTSHWDWGNTYSFDGSIWSKAAVNTPYHGINPSSEKYFVYDFDGTGPALHLFVYSGAYGGLTRLYRLSGSSWTVVKNLPTADVNGYVSNRMGYPVVFNGDLYVSAGRDEYEVVTPVDAKLYRYQPSTGWSVSLSDPRIDDLTGFRTIVFNDGTGEKLYAFGTTVGTSPLDTALRSWVFNGTLWSAPVTVVEGNYRLSCLTGFLGNLYTGIYDKGIYVLENGAYQLAIKPTGKRGTTSMRVWNDRLYAAFNEPGCALYSHGGDNPYGDWKQEFSFSALSINSMAVYGASLYLGLQLAPYRSAMNYSTSAKVLKVSQD